MRPKFRQRFPPGLAPESHDRPLPRDRHRRPPCRRRHPQGYPYGACHLERGWKRQQQGETVGPPQGLTIAGGGNGGTGNSLVKLRLYRGETGSQIIMLSKEAICPGSTITDSAERDYSELGLVPRVSEILAEVPLGPCTN